MASWSANVFQGTKYDDQQFTGEEIVISGMSGVFPKSQSVLEFMENLYNKIDMVSSKDARWTFNNPDMPKYMGKMTGLEKFDAQFFRVSFQLGCVLEPMARKLLEHAYGAVIDSGSNLIELKKSKIGVFIGSSFTDHSALAMFDVNQKRNDFIVNGCSKAMLANRISYWIDGKGPSFGLDYACASSMACLEQAYRSMKAGECDAAIVGGCNYCTQPNLTINLRRAGLLCLDGKTKCFDKNGDGYVRSDAVNILFLQKAKDSKRVYAEVYHAKGIYKMKHDAPFLPIRDPEDMQQFFEEFYAEANVCPEVVEYVEANGAAIAEADTNELKAIENVFAKNRTVKVGCVKSNMGHSEPASGMCAVTKVCLAYHQGKLPANLHYNNPQDHVPGIYDGRLKVVTENEPFKRSFAAVNNFSFTGANYHVLLKGHYKPKNLKRYKSKIPYLVLVSGRQEISVSKILDLLKSQPVDPEQISLLHNIFSNDIPGHTGRGYTILDTNLKNETIMLSENASYYPGDRRPVWFVFSGMGSQWPGMGADLMRIPTFASAIERCHKVLEPKGVDLIKVITDPDDAIFENTLNAFVGIGAVQIGLINVLRDIEIIPDFIIGHSLGEMACAYHDDTFTAEEMILATYIRGKMCVETPHSKGAMAAVGMSYKDMIPLCPPEIDIACHNSSNSCTISGPEEVVIQFVANLTKQGIFARGVATSGLAFHSRYIASARPELLKGLNEIIKNPKPRSSKWISTSIPKDRWNEPLAEYSSAEYHVNNIMSPVLFEETTRLIPPNAIVVEIAPHSLLQAILKRSLKECTHVPLTRRGNLNGVKYLLDALGTLYEAGLNPKIENLYPKIEYPVSTETPLLSHFVDWEHTETWPSVKYTEAYKITAKARDITISVDDDDFKYMKGYAREGLNVLPEAAILVFAWETLAMYNKMDYRDMPVVFQDVRFHSETILKSEIPLGLSVAITKGSDQFEVSQGDTIIASGVIRQSEETCHNHNMNNEKIAETTNLLGSDDIYRIMDLKGFAYNDNFKSIQFTTHDHDKAFVKWSNQWVILLDSLIQLNILARSYDGISVPKFIKKITISITKDKSIEDYDMNCFNVVLDTTLGVTRLAGVEIDTIIFDDKLYAFNEQDTIGVKTFVPFNIMENIDIRTALQVMLQIVAENTARNELVVTQLSRSNISDILSEIISILCQFVSFKVKVNTIDRSGEYCQLNADKEGTNQLIVVEYLLNDEKKFTELHSLKEGDFVLALENDVPKQYLIKKYNFIDISSMSDGKRMLVLLRKMGLVQNVSYIQTIQDEKFSWVQEAASQIEFGKLVILILEKRPFCDLSGLIKKFKQRGMDKLNLLAIDDLLAPRFNPDNIIFREQIRKNLSINVFKNGQWGSYYYTSSEGIANFLNVTLTCHKPGDLESLTWEESTSISHDDTMVKVSYSGLSLRDAQIAAGCSNENQAIGMDYSGIDKNGKKIMGLLPGGSVSSILRGDPDLMWPVPEHWSLEDAATVPLPYVHAYYCLALRCQIFKGQSVFITGGAGALGQALISICLSLNCDIYTSVSHEKKKALLLKLYPQLKDNNILYAGHDTFHNTVISNSKQTRCDFVINCASGPLREAAMKFVGLSGVFLDINNYDMRENKSFGMSFLAKDRTYKAVNLSNIFRPQNVDEKKTLQRLISEGIAKGIVKPLPRVCYAPTDVNKALRTLPSTRHQGRVLIKMQDVELLYHGLKVSPRVTYSSTGVYIVLSDKHGLGLELVERLIKQGAKEIILHHKYCITGYIRKKMALWSSKDARVIMSSDNLQTELNCVKFLKNAAKLGAVVGIFIFRDQNEIKSYITPNDFLENYHKFSSVVKDLDIASRTICPKLSSFVVILQPIQNDADEYSAAVTEIICQARNDAGFPTLVFRVTNKEGKIKIFFNTLERSLKYGNVISIKNTGSNDKGQFDYEKNVANILEMKTLNDIKGETRIQDLNLNEVNLEVLKNIIRKAYQLDYPIQKIQKMTISSLRTIKESFKTHEKSLVERSKGLAAVYNNIVSEEDYLSAYPVVPMITMLNNGTENDFSPKDTYLVMIPGFEGSHKIFTAITKRLKVQAVTIQLEPDMEEKSISELATSARQYMKMKFETKRTPQKFYLLGYSFGINVALELASILEKEGHVGVVFCLDSSPDALRVLLGQNLGNYTIPQLQNAIVQHIYHLMCGQSNQKLLNGLNNLEGWSDKVELCVNSLRGKAPYSNQYKRCILNSLYRRILLAQKYDPRFKLNSELVLIKVASDQEVITLELNDHFNLSKYSTQQIKVFEINCQKPSASFDIAVSNIVNKMLETNLIEKFKKQNLCSTYVLE